MGVSQTQQISRYDDNDDDDDNNKNNNNHHHHHLLSTDYCCSPICITYGHG
jgi:hypothetical protein